MHEETIFRELEYNPDKLVSYAKQMVENPNAIVITKGDPLRAVFIGEVYPHIYTDDLIAVDQLMYVHPSYRRLGYASEMVKAYKEWARGKGAKLTLIGSSTGFEGAEKFFKSKGFEMIGGNYGLW
jgi:GNAT superfamily N-acetyltransferase